MGYYQGDYYAAGGIDWGKLLTKGADILSAVGPGLAGGLMSPSAETGGAAGPMRSLASVFGGGGGGGAGPPGFAAAAAPAAARHLASAGGRRRYRRMNALNPRALRRSMRRVQAFAKFARHTMTFTHHHKMKKHHKRR